MVFGPVSKYSLVNAKVRARLSTLLDEATINRLAETRDLSEFYAALDGTIYEPIFSQPEIAFDPRVGERLLLEREILWHTELLRDLKGAERALVSHFIEKYEIENLKVALRIREGHRDGEEMKYLVRGSLPHALPYGAISEAGSLEEALAYLNGSPFHEPVRRALDAYGERGTLFPVEIGLEIDYYRRLKERVAALAKGDRRIAERLVGLEIDRTNIGWLIRLKFYYDVPVGELLDYNIPGGYRMTADRLREAFKAESLRDVLRVAIEKSYSSVSDALVQGEQLSKLYLLEIILWNYLLVEAKRTLGGFPFTIGTILAYLILKRTEVRNVITILNGKVYRMGRSEIESHLRVAF
ncbi:MAG: V-type ATPase subunit [Candidatus Krumholzibacteriota bacterium]|nr:V-type ATPase subunit [Candidatus Krumholzibacteriota bacterium]